MSKWMAIVALVATPLCTPNCRGEPAFLRRNDGSNR